MAEPSLSASWSTIRSYHLASTCSTVSYASSWLRYESYTKEVLQSPITQVWYYQIQFNTKQHTSAHEATQNKPNRDGHSLYTGEKPVGSVRYHKQSNEQARLLWTIGSSQIKLKTHRSNEVNQYYPTRINFDFNEHYQDNFYFNVQICRISLHSLKKNIQLHVDIKNQATPNPRRYIPSRMEPEQGLMWKIVRLSEELAEM